MTANAMSGDEERSLSAGMQGHIAKPIDEKQLIKAIIKWCVPGHYEDEPTQPADLEEASEHAQADEKRIRYPQVKKVFSSNKHLLDYSTMFPYTFVLLSNCLMSIRTAP